MRLKSLLLAVCILVLAFSLGLAQKKGGKVDLNPNQPTLVVPHGKTDTLWFEFRQEGKRLSADLFLFNDEPVAAAQIPIKYGNGKAPLDVDSVVFDKKRAAKFDLTNAALDSIQSLRIGFIADISGRKPPLEAGRGKLLTIFFNLKTNKPYDVELDTTTLEGGYSLLFADPVAKDIPTIVKKGKFKTK